MRGALTRLVFLVSLAVVATGPVLVAQGAVPSQKPPFAAGQVVARAARTQQMQVALRGIEKHRTGNSADSARRSFSCIGLSVDEVVAASTASGDGTFWEC